MIPPISIEQIAEGTGLNSKFLYLLSNHIPDHYRIYRIPKKNGKFRTIEAPVPVLKRIQQYILWRILPRQISCSPEKLAETAEIRRETAFLFIVRTLPGC